MSVNESNIPVPKRISGCSAKKPRLCKLPELQKYIDSIIKTTGPNSLVDICENNKNILNNNKWEVDKHVSKNKTKVKTTEMNHREPKKLNTNSNPEIETFLKKLYPNPYDLEEVNEFQNTKNICSENDPKQIEDHNNAAVTNFENVFTTTNENKTIQSKNIAEPENCISLEDNSEDKSTGSCINKEPVIADTDKNKSSSRQSSKESDLNLKRKNLQKLKNKVKDQIGNLRKPQDSLPVTEDYDLGKLKLLTTSSEEGMQTDSSKPAEDETQDKYSKPAFQSEDIDDLCQIYNMMDKATESFLAISSRNGQTNMFEELDTIGVQKSSEYKSISESTLNSTKSNHMLVGKPELTSLSEKKIRRMYESDTASTTEGSWRTDSLDQLRISQKGVEGELVETSQKIDEVLEFMYNCIMKFSKSGECENIYPQDGEEEKKNEIIPKVSSKIMQNKSAEDIHHFRSNSSTESSESSRKITKMKNKRKSSPLEYSSRSCPTVEREIYDPRTTMSGDPRPGGSTSRWEPLALNTEPDPLTVEVQNELGGYNEETAVVSCDNLRSAKSVLPLSVKSRRSNTNTCQVIKSALELEEKLLASSRKNNSNELLPSNSGFALIRGFKKQNSNFVICVNSLPRSLKTNNHPKMSFSSSLSISLKSWDFDNFKQPRVHQQQICIVPEPPNQTQSYRYGLKEEIIKITSRSTVAYIAKTILLPMFVALPKSEEILPLRKSEYSVGLTITPFKESSVEVISHNLDYGCIRYLDLTKHSNTKLSTNVEKSVQTLQEALEETEKKAYQLEKDKAENLNKIPESISCVSSPNMRDHEWTSENEKNKVHNLLLRTYNLQNKLQQYLHKMTCLQSPSISCPLIYKETFLNWGLSKSQNPDAKIYPIAEQNSKVFWYLQSQTNPKEEPMQKLSQQTSYHTPDVEKPEAEIDDCSSTYSFKSSRDFSDTEETENTEEKNNRLLKKVLSEIAYFRRKIGKKSKSHEKLEEKRLIKYENETKIPEKFLKTIFRGKESLTELSIGLKDIPMTNVNNISIEKEKYSNNHTKISICISRDRQEVKSADTFRNESFFHNTLRPSISTDVYKLNEEISKTSGTYSTESDDDESDDDYKSVMSTLNDSDVETEKKEISDSKKSSTKTFVKHRFDFYRKMNLDLNFDTNKTSQQPITSTICKYKELEPLQQALTEMQIRMRDIKRHSFFNSSEYYKRALKLAKMSAGYCQSCGNRAVIPEDNFGYYKKMLPRRYSNHKSCYLNTSSHLNTSPPPLTNSFYSFRSSNELSDVNVKQSSSVMFNSTTRSGNSVFKDFPLFKERQRIEHKYFGS